MATPSGGKMVTNRRKQRLSATPYDRPPRPSRSYNWFSGVIVPSARAIASGTGKIISSIFTESESSSSEDEDFDAEQDIDSEIPNGVNAIDEENRVHSDLMPYEISVKRTETKEIIEKLILQETFTREECDWMVKLLNSRIAESSMRSAEGNLLFKSPDKNCEDVDMYDKVTQEAKKWFRGKKVGSISATQKGPGTSKVESGGTSPVDVARSYMKERPCWASPTRNFDDMTPFSSKLFKDGGSSHSVGLNSSSLSKSLISQKKSSLASGSWNIQEELQRVRAKATQEMLLRTPSKKLHPLTSSYTSPGEKILEAGKQDINPQKSTWIESFANRTLSANGVSSSQPPNPSAGIDSKQNHEQQCKENHISDEFVTEENQAINVTNTQANAGETYTEVPIVTETDSIASGLQNNLGVQTEELSVDDVAIPSEVGIAGSSKQLRKKPDNRPIRRGRSKRGL